MFISKNSIFDVGNFFFQVTFDKVTGLSLNELDEFIIDISKAFGNDRAFRKAMKRIAHSQTAGTIQITLWNESSAKD